jgi:hypothetical protein
VNASRRRVVERHEVGYQIRIARALGVREVVARCDDRVARCDDPVSDCVAVGFTEWRALGLPSRTR